MLSTIHTAPQWRQTRELWEERCRELARVGWDDAFPSPGPLAAGVAYAEIACQLSVAANQCYRGIRPWLRLQEARGLAQTQEARAAYEAATDVDDAIEAFGALIDQLDADFPPRSAVAIQRDRPTEDPQAVWPFDWDAAMQDTEAAILGHLAWLGRHVPETRTSLSDEATRVIDAVGACLQWACPEIKVLYAPQASPPTAFFLLVRGQRFIPWRIAEGTGHFLRIAPSSSTTNWLVMPPDYVTLEEFILRHG